MRTRELLRLRNTGHPGINSLFAKAHSADWDFERDVDWRTPIAADDPLVAHGFAAYGRTPTFQALPERVKAHATRRAVGRLLNILQVGESVAQNVCARLVLELREEDYRNHAAAQAMDGFVQFVALLGIAVVRRIELGELAFGNEVDRPDPLAFDRQLLVALRFLLRRPHARLFESHALRQQRRRAFESFARKPAHFDPARFLILGACRRPRAAFARFGEQFGRGAQLFLGAAQRQFERALLGLRSLAFDPSGVRFGFGLGDFGVERGRASGERLAFLGEPRGARVDLADAARSLAGA